MLNNAMSEEKLHISEYPICETALRHGKNKCYF